ncbi:DNA repair protein [Colletotrichum truncatum]|uniref:DNA repair protein n=1 Tax=Colletotrichum truncatum TaxID=5467 RepID=A0ACC3ZG06_COLTU|nr:DNA repair protein [Colletotrichum truncatum]KAF6801944.1 DNA repair protein [Colletotrichum truncatum]
MPQSQFVPARNSRHRVAVIALFRALIREGRGITLPQDVCRKGKSPVSELIKRGFKRNKSEVSPRLVFAALSAGYKFLTFFKNAQTQGSNEHDEIITYLREKNEMIARAEANRRPQWKPRELKPDHKPLLKKISKPNEPPVYVSPIFPRPRDSFEGRRKIPHIVASASGHIFLRHKGPQPYAVSNLLRRKQARKVRFTAHLLDIENENWEFATEEDNWEKLVNQALGKKPSRKPRMDPWAASYAESVNESYRNLVISMNRFREDEVAKGRALIEAVKGEEKLLEQEVLEAKQYGVRIVPTDSEKIQPYIAYRKVRKTRRHVGFRRRKVKRWQSRFIGLEPTPIRV